MSEQKSKDQQEEDADYMHGFMRDWADNVSGMLAKSNEGADIKKAGAVSAPQVVKGTLLDIWGTAGAALYNTLNMGNILDAPDPEEIKKQIDRNPLYWGMDYSARYDEKIAAESAEKKMQKAMDTVPKDVLLKAMPAMRGPYLLDKLNGLDMKFVSVDSLSKIIAEGLEQKPAQVNQNNNKGPGARPAL